MRIVQRTGTLVQLVSFLLLVSFTLQQFVPQQSRYPDDALNNTLSSIANQINASYDGSLLTCFVNSQ
jgi:hypothetical protein